MVTRADIAAADLHARIVQDALDGPLSGVEALVCTLRGHQLQVTLFRLPLGAVASTALGLAPTPAGARITDRLHQLAKLACDHAGLTRKSVFRIRPDALAAAAGPFTVPQRRAS